MDLKLCYSILGRFFWCVYSMVRALEIGPFVADVFSVCVGIGAAAGIRTRVVGLEGQWTRKRNVLDQARLRPQAVHENAFSANKGSRPRGRRLLRQGGGGAVHHKYYTHKIIVQEGRPNT
jgi:hypothetical protein